jgi:hypothetical protein
MHFKFHLILAIGLLFPAYAFSVEQFTTEQEAQNHCPYDTVVWLNTSSGMIHAKGGKWYGLTKTGAYVCQKEITAASNKSENSRFGATRWKAIGKTDAFDGGATIYVDRAAIQHHGDNTDMWTLMDFRNVQEMAGLKFRSSKFRKEYNCKQGQWKILMSAMLEKNMGKGRVVQSDAEPEEWKKVEPGSIAEDEWGWACKHKSE